MESKLSNDRSQARRIRALRDLLALSQSQLAVALRVSKRTISRWETGASPVHRVYLDKLEGMAKLASIASVVPVREEASDQTT